MEINLQGEKLTLHSEKAIYWPREDALLLADLHLGKAAHFRSEGIPVPMQIQTVNLNRIAKLIAEFLPKRVLFLGDLFHSFYNSSWETFCKFLGKYPTISFELVIGNHDILTDEHYESAGLVIHEEPYFLPPFSLSHHPQDEIIDGFYNLYGHIHPCVYLQGQGKQVVRLACFHFSKYHGVLPAFGEFTGMAKMQTSAEDKVFVVIEGAVLEV